MKKFILWGVVGILALGTAIAAVWWSSRPQIILLRDGTKLTLVGVTHGRHHVPPKIKIAGSRNRGNAAFDTQSNSIVVWVESESKKQGPNQWPNYQLFVYDHAETACVSTWSRGSSEIKNGVYLQGFPLDAFPRRESKILLRVSAQNNTGNPQIAKGQFVISNPLRGESFAKWTAEPIPDTQSDGDLNVTLTKCVFGVEGFNNRGGSPKDPVNKAVFAAFHCEQNGGAATNWQPIRIETSDASGNHAQIYSWSTGRDDATGDATMTYQWGLWPAESPWKLRVEMSRTSGFNRDESWEIPNVPVQPGTWNDLWNIRATAAPTPPLPRRL